MKKKRGRPRKITRREKVLKAIRIVSIILMVVLMVELGFLAYKSSFSGSKKSYLDSINDFVYSHDYYITVGSNNNNDKMTEKAKITRYDYNKEKIWEQVYNRGYTSSYLGVTADNDDNIVAVGSCEDSKGENKEALLVKYDKRGNIIFERRLNSLEEATFTSVEFVEDGYLVAGQSIYKNRTLGDGVGGAILIKYDLEGNLLWKSNYGDNKTAIYNGLVTHGDYIYTVGKYNNSKAIVAKYDDVGSLIAYETFDNIDEFGLTGIAINDNSLVVSGSKIVDSYNTDAILIKLNLDCEYQKNIVYKGKGKERFNKVISDQNSFIAIGTTAISNKKNEYSYDSIIAKYNHNLKKVGVVIYGDTKNDYFTQIRLVDNDYLVSGYSSYKDEGYLSKFITYSSGLKVLEVK